jgi:hypothetical protein
MNEPAASPGATFDGAGCCGGCLCGAVRIAVPTTSLWMAHCHCSLCRRAHGAGFVTWIGYPAMDCRVDDARHQLRWYASSPGAERAFCATCGSSLLFRSERWPGELHVAVAALDDPPERAPQAHVFWSSHVAWSGADPADGLPRKD